MSQIQSLASEYLADARPTGEDGLRAKCPFCSSSRAFIINLNHGGWICFSCSQSGSLVAFMSRVAGMTRKQIATVTSTMSLEPRRDVSTTRKLRLRESWSVLPEYILGAYDDIPEQLLAVGFTEETLRGHSVGTDTINNRITFAIRDYLGRLTAISGRAMHQWQIPRYKVYDARPPTDQTRAGEFFGVVQDYRPDNRRHLYGIDTVHAERFYTDSKDLPPLIVTEGYKSTLWLRQLGFKHTVGLQGSSMTFDQLVQLGRLRGPYFIMLDHEPGKAYPDRKGQCAAIDLALSLQSSGRSFVCLYEGKETSTSPDDLHDPEEVMSMIQNAKTVGQLKIMMSRG